MVPAVIEIDSESKLTSLDNETDTDRIDMTSIAILGKNKGSDDEEFVDTRVEQEAEEEEEDEDEIEDECQDDEEEDKGARAVAIFMPTTLMAKSRFRPRVHHPCRF